MQDYDKTTRFAGTTNQSASLLVTIFDSATAPHTIRLDEFGKNFIYFGRDPKNDIVLASHLVSAEHGRFLYKDGVWIIEDKAIYQNVGSTNGLIYNNASIISHSISEGDFIRIDDGVETISDGVLFVFSSADSDNRWHSIPLSGRQELTIGRGESCDIVLPHISVSKCHAKIAEEQGYYYIVDDGSTNGIIVNNRQISGKQLLHEKDVIVSLTIRLQAKNSLFNRRNLQNQFGFLSLFDCILQRSLLYLAYRGGDANVARGFIGTGSFYLQNQVRGANCGGQGCPWRLSPAFVRHPLQLFQPGWRRGTAVWVG